MKSILASTGLILALCAGGFAQDSGDRIVVPARDGSRRTVNCHLLNGSITVRSHSGNDVIVENEGGGSPNSAPPGMHRIGGNTRGVEVVEENNVITVRRSNGNGSVSMTVPANISLSLHTLSGAITVDGVHGDVEVHTLNGHVSLTHIVGSVSGDSSNGPLNVSMDGVDSSKSLAFSTMNGAVDLTLPTDVKANLNVRTNHGEVYSDFEVTLGATRLNGGQYRVRADNNIHGTINGGGVDITIHTLNGAVYIRKKK